MEKKGFHETENWFPPNRMKDLFQKHVSVRKIKLTVEGMSENRRKNRLY